MRDAITRGLVGCLIVLAAAGCSAPTPRVTDELSDDGLARVENSAFASVWVRPGISLAGYSKLMLKGVGIQYRLVEPASRSRRATSGTTTFPIDERQRAGIESIMREVFSSELARSKRFTIVDEPGPDVLLLVGGLLDVVSFVPPAPVGRGEVFLRSVGEATLVFELYDSETNAILVRGADRRSAEQAGPMQRSNTASNTFEVRSMARTWATRLRERLEAAAEIPVLQ